MCMYDYMVWYIVKFNQLYMFFLSHPKEEKRKKEKKEQEKEGKDEKKDKKDKKKEKTVQPEVSNRPERKKNIPLIEVSNLLCFISVCLYLKKLKAFYVF